MSEDSLASEWIANLPSREAKGLAAYETIARVRGKVPFSIETSQKIERFTCVDAPPVTVNDSEKIPCSSTILPTGRLILYPPTVSSIGINIIYV